MPQQQPSPSVENHFIAGLKTEFTGLNFPENAATDTQNCVYTLIGDVNRRGGIDYESNAIGNAINAPSVARSSYKWLNAGGDGSTQIVVEQIGSILYFFRSSSATVSAPLSTQRLNSIINVPAFQAVGNTNNVAITECQYSSGNGYLFVFHPDCDSFYCTYSSGSIAGQVITLQTRDFVGIPEPNVADNFRPNTLSNEHLYNLVNQGWSQGIDWSGNGTFNTTGMRPDGQGGFLWPSPGDTVTLNISNQRNTTSVTNGSLVQLSGQGALVGANNNNTNLTPTCNGTVSSYVSPFNTITLFISSVSYAPNFGGHQPSVALGQWSGGNFFPTPGENISMSLVNVGFINTWKTAIGNYPSNSDIWWLYKDVTTGNFSPGAEFGNVQQLQTASPKGSFVLNPFNQDRSNKATINGLTTVSTTQRPLTGTFYQGRVFYAGVNASFPATGDEPFYTWTENIYFSQIITDVRSFSKCFQENDPTSQTLFSILPSDGGQIVIPGCGAIYKLFALRFGVLVFAANGIWFVGGSTGIGFAANDYTVTKISSIRAISGTSFIEVQGFPYFWNEEGIYEVSPAQTPGSAHSPDIQLSVNNLALGSILSYYAGFPSISKKFARGDYHELDYVVQWCFRSTSETGISNRYNYDTILNFNIVTKAFYPFTLPTNSLSVVTDVKYIQSPGGSGAPNPVFKYTTAVGPNITFSEENDFTRFVDFFSENQVGYNFISYFITGYKLVGKALLKFQSPYVYVFSRNPSGNSYYIQAIWDYAGSGLSGKFSVKQKKSNLTSNFFDMYHKVRLRGRGLAMQIKVTSVDGMPFDLMGWGVWNEVNVQI